MEKTKGPAAERFWTIKQCRPFDTTLNVEHLSRLVSYEAMQPACDLKRFLKVKVLSGNSGDIAIPEIRDLACELFASVRSEGYIAPLRSDDCLGYTPHEERLIKRLLRMGRAVSAITIAKALGYVPPKPRRY